VYSRFHELQFELSEVPSGCAEAEPGRSRISVTPTERKDAMRILIRAKEQRVPEGGASGAAGDTSTVSGADEAACAKKKIR
jgi:hypothetical protein